MSYCRFTECDVYAYDSEGGVQFYVARSVGDDLDRLCPTYNEAYRYAKNLRDKYGADIPDHTIHALRAEALEEAERISGPKSAVAELLDENAKLRELVKYIHTLATDYGVYVQYPYCDAWDEKLAVAEKQMRELGIEVPS